MSAVAISFCNSLEPLRVIVIECDGTLVAVGGKEICGDIAQKWRTPAARLIANAGPLHFDDVSAEIAQKHSAVRTGQRFGHFHYTDAIENVGHREGL